MTNQQISETLCRRDTNLSPDVHESCIKIANDMAFEKDHVFTSILPIAKDYIISRLGDMDPEAVEAISETLDLYITVLRAGWNFIFGDQGPAEFDRA